MFFYSGLLAAALYAVAGAVQFDIPAGGLIPIEGQQIDLAYSGAQGPVTVTLKRGPIDDLQDVIEIGTGGSGQGVVSWTPTNLPSDTYALEINDGTETNYSPRFVFQGTGPAITDTETDTPTGTATDTTETDATPTPDTTPTPTTMATMTTETDTEDTATPTDNATPTGDDDAAATEPINQNENNANPRLGSSMALVLGAAALLATFN